jgi:putative DNA primase/helicase
VSRADAAAFARGYRELGLVTIRLAPGLKHPNYRGWKSTHTDPEHWLAHPHDGIAIRLAPSGLVGLDIDDEARSEIVLRHFGLELSELKAHAPCAIGRHPKLFYRAPDIELKHRSVTWPKPNGERGTFVLWEFRGGNISDTLPPTIHPGTGQPYRWENPPREGFPSLPSRLLELWLDWEETARQACALCPWAPPPKSIPERWAPRRDYTGPSVIEAFNAAHDIGQILERHGYVRRGKRFASPETSHGAGVVLLDDGRVFCHHQGDPLHGEHALDAFDIYRVLEHGGDYRCAVKAAAEALGLNQEARHGHR